jgi:hypothetical protein
VIPRSATNLKNFLEPRLPCSRWKASVETGQHRCSSRWEFSVGILVAEFPHIPSYERRGNDDGTRGDTPGREHRWGHWLRLLGARPPLSASRPFMTADGTERSEPLPTFGRCGSSVD